MGSLLIVTGPPGAGKSTVAEILASRLPLGVLVKGDVFFGFLGRSMIDPWLPESSDQNAIVANAAAAATREFVIGGYDTVYDGVLGPWSLSQFTTGLRSPAAGPRTLDYAVLLPPVEVCVERVATRVGHEFGDEPATRKMHAEFTAALPELPDRHVFADAAANAVGIADAIAAARVGGGLTLGAAGAGPQGGQ